jgi:hypothetical protein
MAGGCEGSRLKERHALRLGILVCDDVQLQPFLAAKRGSSTSHVETSEKGLAGET